MHNNLWPSQCWPEGITENACFENAAPWNAVSFYHWLVSRGLPESSTNLLIDFSPYQTTELSAPVHIIERLYLWPCEIQSCTFSSPLQLYDLNSYSSNGHWWRRDDASQFSALPEPAKPRVSFVDKQNVVRWNRLGFLFPPSGCCHGEGFRKDTTRCQQRQTFLMGVPI